MKITKPIYYIPNTYYLQVHYYEIFMENMEYEILPISDIYLLSNAYLY